MLIHAACRYIRHVMLLVLLAVLAVSTPRLSPAAGLIFIEDFSSARFMDPTGTTANWSVTEGMVTLPKGRHRTLPFKPDTEPFGIGRGPHIWGQGLEVGDLNGDDFTDVLFTIFSQSRNWLFLNGGEPDLFHGVVGLPLTDNKCWTFDFAVADADADGDMDVAIACDNFTSPLDRRRNRLFLNNGTANPFEGVTGLIVGGFGTYTQSIALGDVSGDGLPDLVVGSWWQPLTLHLNNGTADPFRDSLAIYAGPALSDAGDIAFGDMNGDGHTDIVVADGMRPIRLYINNGTAIPFTWSSLQTVPGITNWAINIELADMNNNGHLDLVVGDVGHGAVHPQLYLNNGTPEPFAGAVPRMIGEGQDLGRSVNVADLDGDGHLDVTVVNNHPGKANRFYLNNGTLDPFGGVQEQFISVDEKRESTDARLADVNNDGRMDLVTSDTLRNSVYLNSAKVIDGEELPFFDTTKVRVVSRNVNESRVPVSMATLMAKTDVPLHTGIEFFLSNTGGKQWFLVKPGRPFHFPKAGTDLRWKAHLSSLSPTRSPEIRKVALNTLPESPKVEVTANGTAGKLAVSRKDSVSVTAQSDCGSFSDRDVEWWLLARTSLNPPWDLLHYRHPSTWVIGEVPMRTGKCGESWRTRVLSTTALPRGRYNFFFGIDFAPNGIVDWNALYRDEIVVVVR